MKRVLIRELKLQVGNKVLVRGFVESVRDQKKAIFLIVRDSGFKVQVFVWKNEENSDLLITLSKLTPESTIEVSGSLISNPLVKLNGYEIIPESISILSLANSPMPIDGLASLQDRLDWRFLDLRKFENLSIFRIQTFLEMSMRKFFIDENFIEIHSPKLIGAASESGAELFSVKYFDTLAYLAQSPQF